VFDHRRRSLLTRLAAGVYVAATVAGCDDDSPETGAVAPVEVTAPSAARTPRPEGALDFGDVYGRLLPSFEDQVIAAELRARLDAFAAAYHRGDDVAARRALASAHALVARSGDHVANVGAVRLALARAGAVLDSATAPGSAAAAPAADVSRGADSGGAP
jgi:hypothetical protein